MRFNGRLFCVALDNLFRVCLVLGVLSCNARSPCEVVAEDAAQSVAAKTSEEENRILGEFCNSIEEKKSGSDQVKRDFWNSHFELALPKLKSDEARATLYRLHADHATSQGDRPEAIRIYQILVEKYSHTKEYPGGVAELMGLAERENDHPTLLTAALATSQVASDGSKKVKATGKAAMAMIGLGEFSHAVELVQALPKDDLRNAEEVLQIMNNVAVKLIDAQQVKLAQQVLDAAYSATPADKRNTPLLGNLATVAAMTGQKEQAVKYHEEAKRLFPNDERVPAYDFSIASLQFELGNYAEARAHYQAVLDSKSSFAGLSNLKKLSAENIENIVVKTTGTIGKSGFNPAIKNNTFRYLLSLNVLIVVCVAAVVLWRWKTVRNRV